jgi:hypothetical protein
MSSLLHTARSDYKLFMKKKKMNSKNPMVDDVSRIAQNIMYDKKHGIESKFSEYTRELPEKYRNI